MFRPRYLPLAAALLALAGCGRSAHDEAALDDLDNILTENVAIADPAVAAAINGPIMTDPELAGRANADAVRPPARPDTGAVPGDAVGSRADGVDARALRHAPAAKGPCPECRTAEGALTLGALAERQGTRAAATCAAGIAYGAAWATRLPPELPVYPSARVVEAAGNDDGGCALRIVSFVSTAPIGRVLDWYYTRATGAGYSAEHKAQGREHVLGGARGGRAYMVYLTERVDGGTDVDLVSG